MVDIDNFLEKNKIQEGGQEVWSENEPHLTESENEE